jgi:ferredoxin
MRGFIGHEATHAAAQDQVIREFLIGNGVDPAPMLNQVEYMFEKVLAPRTFADPARQLNNLCERLWLIAAIEHYTAVLGDFALNSSWDEHGADPTMVDLFRWHGSEEVEHPAPMLTAIRTALVGRDDVELHFERFAAPHVVDGRDFSVSVASTGQAVRVGADETLLSALNRAKVRAPYSCQQGFCGTCRTRVLAGAVDHRDTLLTGPERAGGMMLTCVSRAVDGSHLSLGL